MSNSWPVVLSFPTRSLIVANEHEEVMIWELGQDTRDDTSLLKAIERAAKAAKP
jgi:hypothetical protein